MSCSKAISDHEVEWLQFWANESINSPEVAILYSLVEGRGELIMFGGIRRQPKPPSENRDNPDNDSVSNALYFLNPPCKVVWINNKLISRIVKWVKWEVYYWMLNQKFVLWDIEIYKRL